MLVQLPCNYSWHNACVRPITSSPYACCNKRYVSVAVFPILKQNLIQMRCSVLSHIVKIAMTQAHVLLPRPTTANWANTATCNLCHELLRHVRTCQEWLQTHPTQWTTTTIPIRLLFEQTSYLCVPMDYYNKQRLFPYTALIHLYWRFCLLWGRS